MATNFPGSLDAAYWATGSAAVNNQTKLLADHINSIQEAIVALENKVGANSSAVTTSIDYKLTNASSSSPGHKHSGSDLVAGGGIPESGVTRPGGTPLLVRQAENETVTGRWKFTNGANLSLGRKSQTLSAATDTIVNGSAVTDGNLVELTNSSGGALTLTSTPTISTTNVTPGQIVTLVNIGSSDIVLKNGSTYSLRLPLGSDMTLQQYDSATLVYSPGLSCWVEVGGVAGGGSQGPQGPQGPAGPSTMVVAGSSQFPLTGDNTMYVGSTSSSDEADVGIPAPALTTFNTVAVTLSDAPGTNKSWTITVMKDDTPITGASTTITNDSKYALLTSLNQSFSAGQKFSLKVEPTNSPTPTIINFTAQAVLN